ncbi:MAG: SDR family oxidoreductase [Candidatus Neomarinimicrobiota bacterium]|jgi:NAD(P)-dependent dehydrogenase (short-subunit alcohol dehydrogenase family)|nr:SDR family oxidoreductase [Candidatus Neomarinimicrobiota bacterium]|tara:strand:+ start:331 stop:1053 length:723 start_codon:yes stop_codon:yes gene_type:complete
MNIILLGGTGSIGTEILKNLSDKPNHSFYISSTKYDLLNDYKNKFNCEGEILDLKNNDHIEEFFNNANSSLGNIDAVINCVGSILLKPLHIATVTEILEVFQLNTFQSALTIKYSIPLLKKNGGSIILFSSAAAKVGLKNHDLISPAKGAIDSMVKSCAMTYARFNIRINAIAPGLVNSNMSQNIINNKFSLDFSRKLHPLNRIGEPKNIVPAVKWLLDENSDWITGKSIRIDGGLSDLK